MTTIKDVAKEACVSPSTASYALKGGKKVRPDTRERVLRAAEKLHYVPNRVAQSFRSGKSRVITVITNESIENANTFTSEFFGILSGARKYQYDVLIKLVSSPSMEERLLRQTFSNRLSDGYILLGNLPDLYIKCAIESGIPSVLLSSHSQFPISQINSDGYKGIRELTQAALKKGHSKFGYITYQLETKEECLRYDAFLDTIKQAGMIPHLHIVGNDCGRLKEELDNVILEKEDCLICWNDHLAFQTIWKLKQMHISVPGKIGVTGFDGIQLKASDNLSLTTVIQPFQLKGQTAVDLLIGIIKGKYKEPKNLLLPCQFIWGTSM